MSGCSDFANLGIKQPKVRWWELPWIQVNRKRALKMVIFMVTDHWSVDSLSLYHKNLKYFQILCSFLGDWVVMDQSGLIKVLS